MRLKPCGWNLCVAAKTRTVSSGREALQGRFDRLEFTPALHVEGVEGRVILPLDRLVSEVAIKGGAFPTPIGLDGLEPTLPIGSLVEERRFDRLVERLVSGCSFYLHSESPSLAVKTEQ